VGIAEGFQELNLVVHPFLEVNSCPLRQSFYYDRSHEQGVILLRGVIVNRERQLDHQYEYDVIVCRIRISL
jgi:hypothetical protein